MKIYCVIMVILCAVGLVESLPSIPQDAAYHVFADNNTWWGITNTGNVISNLAFIIAGMASLLQLKHLPKTAVVRMWKFFFGTVVLVGVGSAYYHWGPSNDTLFWDRLPMTLCFTALTACVCAERISEKVGRVLFVPLVVSGMLSVVYWWVTEKYGLGDLRPYILVQYLPMLLIPILVLIFPRSDVQNRPYWLLFASYLIAKGFELADSTVFNLTFHIISGHTLKHLVAGAGILFFRPDIPAEADEENFSRSLIV